MLDFSLDGNRQHYVSNITSEDINRSSRDANFYINPVYNLYHESETRIFSFNGGISAGYAKNRNEGPDANQNKKMSSNGITIVTSLREYRSSSFFILAQENATLSYDFSYRKETDGTSIINDREDLERIFSTATKIGIGIGRVRNVTPMIRAIRLKERYGIVSDRYALNEQQLLLAGGYVYQI